MKRFTGIAIGGVLAGSLLTACTGESDTTSGDGSSPSVSSAVTFEPDPLWELTVSVDAETELGLAEPLRARQVGEWLVVAGAGYVGGGPETVIVSLESGEILARFPGTSTVDGMRVDTAPLAVVDAVVDRYVVGRYEDDESIGIVAFSLSREVLWRTPVDSSDDVVIRDYNATHLLFDAVGAEYAGGPAVLDVETGDVLWRGDEAATGVSLIRDVVVVSTQDDEHRLSTIDWRSDEPLWQWTGAEAEVISRTETHLVLSASEGTAVVDIATGETVAELPYGLDQCHSAAVDFVVCRTSREHTAEHLVTITADEEGVSLNQRFAITRARFVGERDGRLCFLGNDGSYFVMTPDGEPVTMEFPGRPEGGFPSGYVAFVTPTAITVHRMT